jgi:hypothetical protein
MKRLRILVVAGTIAAMGLIPAAASASSCTSQALGSSGHMSSLSCDDGVSGTTYCYGSGNRYCDTNYSTGVTGNTVWSSNGRNGETTYSNGGSSTTYCYGTGNRYCDTTGR